jgi:Uma2 family endonuclease
MSVIPLQRLMSVQEYLRFDETSETKYEYIAGEIVAMAGGKHAHNVISMDVSRILGNYLESAGGTCDVYNSDQKVRYDDAGPFFYPDVTVVCGTPEIDHDHCLRNPTLIVEVLSETSEEYDRGEKFRNYRQFPTLRHYLLVAQDMYQVEHYRQIEGVLWELVATHTDITASIPLPDLNIALPLAEIYRRLPPVTPQA